MLPLILIYLVITPTFTDRSDINLNTNKVLKAQAITLEALLEVDAYFEAIVQNPGFGLADVDCERFGSCGGNVPMEPRETEPLHGCTVGLVNEMTATYEPDANNILRYIPAWYTQAGIDPIIGLYVTDETGQIIFRQNVSYNQATANIRISRDRETLTYHLNGVEVFTKFQIGLVGVRNVRGHTVEPSRCSDFLLERGTFAPAPRSTSALTRGRRPSFSKLLSARRPTRQ